MSTTASTKKLRKSAKLTKAIRLEYCMEVAAFARHYLGLTGQAVFQYEAGSRVPRLHIIGKYIALAKDKGMEVTVYDFIEV